MEDAKNISENGFLSPKVPRYFVPRWLTSWIWVLSSVLFMNHRNILISELMQLIDLCIVLTAIKSSLFIDLLKSIGSSEPTYVSRNDDWFKTVPNLVMWNVSITSILICLAMRQVFTWCIFSPPEYTLVEHKRVSVLSHYYVFNPQPSMDLQYHLALLRTPWLGTCVDKLLSWVLKVKC